MGTTTRERRSCAEDVEGLTVGGLLDPWPDAARTTTHSSTRTGVRYTYGQFREVVERCARALMALGLEKETTSRWGQNVPEWVILQFATGKMGAVLVTVNPAYKAQELKYVLDQSDCGPVPH